MTYTTQEAMKLLNVKPAGFHKLRRNPKYKSAFVVVHQGTGHGNPTTYAKEPLDKFIQWRKQY